MLPERVSMQWIKQQSKGHFFDPDTMRFFGSRLPEYGLLNRNRVYFFTSDQCRFEGGKYPRRWTLRVLNIVTGEIDTVGDFQQYATAAKAKEAVIRAARNEITEEIEP